VCVFSGLNLQASSLRNAIDLVIYLSVAFGLLLVIQIYALVPTWLFYSVLVGWIVYLLVAVAVATRHKIAYPAAFILAIITLMVSLPQPEHYGFVEAGLSLASTTFIIGSVLQVAILLLIPIYLLKRRNTKTSSNQMRPRVRMDRFYRRVPANGRVPPLSRGYP
jgi:hypothetical protein